jgi:hypothetical protein
MFTTVSRPFPWPIYGRQSSRFAPDGAWNLNIGLASYKHFVPPGLFPSVCATDGTPAVLVKSV